ncbi:ADP-ribose pyrophosphatase YjhB (NUDIX family) [Nocardioides sp. J9]|uniref:NUDIX hydrolase n=1 Tax=unclassified Nocardioides TaxID=2615069 RepID=UPI00048DC7A1|nr:MULTISPECIES: NUDIX domain-containing protein [unclassified Nocardioides]TWH02866.1 ADP-ribose pyrophosphatase YjhB (NUDIX family) [Nocardioides sp. J9]
MTTGLPGEPTRRTVARVLPVSAEDRVLLLLGCDPAVPDVQYWFTVGGAADPGEPLAHAGVRELREETGIEVDPAALGDPFGTFEVEFSWNGRSYVNESTLFAVAVEETPISFAGLDHLESQSIFDARWWTPEELHDDGRAVDPRLIDQMRAAIAHVRGGLS